MDKEINTRAKGGDAEGAVADTFKYEQLDGDMAQFLRTKETNIRKSADKIKEGFAEWGMELKEAQERLAGDRYSGVFEAWYTSLGYSKRSVYNYIDYFLGVQLLHTEEERELFEALPKPLAYAISAKSAESTPAKAQAKAEVLAGEIDTGKAYKERIAELEAENERKEQRAKQAERSEEIAVRKLEEVESGNPEFEIRTEYVEIDDLSRRKEVWLAPAALRQRFS